MNRFAFRGLAAGLVALPFAACGDLGDPVVEGPVTTPAQPPRIAYEAVVTDTAGFAVHHAPTSTGGPVSSWRLLGSAGAPSDPFPLPEGLSLDTVTGVISGTPTFTTVGVPKRALSVEDGDGVLWDRVHSVVARGPGGKDTASIRIRVVSMNVFVPLTPPGGHGSRCRSRSIP